jgi:hypothetical protein
MEACRRCALLCALLSVASAASADRALLQRAAAAAKSPAPFPHSSLEACLAAAPLAALLVPSSSGYARSPLLTTYNIRFDGRRPAAVASVDSEAGVVAAVRCARAWRVRAVARGGGHSFGGHSVQDGVVVIDTSRMRSVRVDAAAATATVQAGATLGALWTAAAAVGRAFPTGSCPTVGVSGFLLGGGQGIWMRSWGLGCDRVLGLRAVTAAGEAVVAAPAGAHADLFWASCGGGGGNFAIVTEWRVRLAPRPAGVQAAVLEFAGAAAAAEAWVAFDAWATGADAAVGSSASLGARSGAARLRVDAYSIAKGASLRAALPASLVSRATAARFDALDWHGALANERQPGFNVTGGSFTPAQRVRRHEKSYVLGKPLRCVPVGRLGRPEPRPAPALSDPPRPTPPRAQPHRRAHARRARGGQPARPREAASVWRRRRRARGRRVCFSSPRRAQPRPGGGRVDGRLGRRRRALAHARRRAAAAAERGRVRELPRQRARRQLGARLLRRELRAPPARQGRIRRGALLRLRRAGRRARGRRRGVRVQAVPVRAGRRARRRPLRCMLPSRDQIEH